MVQQTASNLFQVTRTQWIDEARQAMYTLLQSGKPYVTSDDVWRVCPLPSYLHKNTVGAVFSGRDFKQVGYTKSKRNAANGRVIQRWALK